MSKRITPSLVISVIALVVALGGASYAALKIPKNSVGSKQLKKNSVTAKKIKKNAVTAAKLKAGSVNSSKVKDGTLLRSDFQAGQINGDAWLARRDSAGLFDVTTSFEPVVTTPVLPAGSYVLQGRANVLGSPIASILICSLANDAAQNFTVASNAVFPLSMAATTVLAEPAPIELNCLKSAGTPQIAQAHIIATSVNSVTGPPD